jgi:nitric oxide dioxygenase
MTSRQIELVENSWEFILRNTNDAGAIFYSRLFEINPTLRTLFKEDIESQAQKLVSLITFAVHKLYNLEEILDDVKALGARHAKYNVKSEHYASVANALLWTLEKSLNAQWTEEMEDAWISVYNTLSKTMIDAAEDARSQEKDVGI